jgi:hypothetical protein
MIKSSHTHTDSGRSSSAWSLLVAAHPSSRAYDPRPLWQRLDDAEDQQLIRQQRLVRRLRVLAIVVAGAALLFWLLIQ